ncbi:MAG: hypothetical protein MUO88_19675 [Desulfobacterales bacterium]|nr:hypothetical protein [Desulfobacterales bacterium]
MELLRLYRTGGIEILPRLPLIPGYTDTKTNLEAICNYLVRHQVNKIRIMPYHPLWQGKNRKIGVEIPNTGVKNLSEWSTPTTVRECKQIFLDAGIEV